MSPDPEPCVNGISEKDHHHQNDAPDVVSLSESGDIIFEEEGNHHDTHSSDVVESGDYKSKHANIKAEEPRVAVDSDSAVIRPEAKGSFILCAILIHTYLL